MHGLHISFDLPNAWSTYAGGGLLGTGLSAAVIGTDLHSSSPDGVMSEERREEIDSSQSGGTEVEEGKCGS